NGGEFEVVGLILNPRSSVRTLGGNVRVHTLPPLALILRGSKTLEARVDGLPPGTIAVMYSTIPMGGTICKARSGLPGRRSEPVRRTGLPITFAVSMIDYKSQGKGFEDAILTLQGKTKAMNFESFYVQLSRCRSLNALRLLEPLRLKD
ncbi:hypothetical protein B0T21DRAFT_271187, partial [Apiosordaria backusii]